MASPTETPYRPSIIRTKNGKRILGRFDIRHLHPLIKIALKVILHSYLFIYLFMIFTIQIAPNYRELAVSKKNKKKMVNKSL